MTGWAFNRSHPPPSLIFAEHCSHWPSITHILLQSVQQMSTMNSSLHLDSRKCRDFSWDATFLRKYRKRLREMTEIRYSIISHWSSVIIARASYQLNWTSFSVAAYREHYSRIWIYSFTKHGTNVCSQRTSNIRYLNQGTIQLKLALMHPFEPNRNVTAMTWLWEKSRQYQFSP